MIAVLQGLMSSEDGTSAGGVTGDVTGSELAEVLSAKSCECYGT